ncbi:MAG: decaprenyl-phosphate phosphoribosyltransferase [Phycisphaerales bacterium]|nr:decaprenyl-phosphate phosphoribosyltransferase [Phycisphaerales bacterium]
MTHEHNAQPEPIESKPAGGLIPGLIRLARPHQWSKGIFVLIGPLFAIADGKLEDMSNTQLALAVGLTFFGFCLAASGCYVFNDLADVERDRAHPRKKKRPLASGQVPVKIAKVFGVCLLALSLLFALGAPEGLRIWVLGLIVLYIINVMLYSSGLKHIVIIDVLSLSSGFVLRVLGGCAAVGITPSTWLLNATLFLSMFLAFGKRLGERRHMGSDEDATAVRDVQQHYTDQMLRMFVVVTGVATLLTYTGYVQSQEIAYMHIFATRQGSLESYGFGMNLLWITVAPATLALLRTITLLMRGRYDDPTELAMRDNMVRVAGLTFVASMVFVIWFHMNPT